MNPSSDESPVGLRNWIAFIAFTLVVVFGWQLIFPAPPPAPRIPTPEPSPSTSTFGEESSAAPSVGPVAASSGQMVRTEASHVQRVRLRTPHASVELTNLGGRITSWTLPDHPGYWSKEHPLELVRSPLQDIDASGETPVAPLPVPDDAVMLPLQVLTGEAALDARLAQALHVIEVDEGATGGKRVAMRWSDGAGTSVEKILSFRNDLPVTIIEARLTVEGRPRDFRLGWGPGIGDHSPSEKKNMYFRRGRLVYRAVGELEHAERPDKAENLPLASVDFAGLEDSFFSVLFIPGVPEEAGRPVRRSGFRLLGDLPPKPSGSPGSGKAWPEHLVLAAPFSPAAPLQSFYAGANDREILERVDALFEGHRGLSEVTDYGYFIGPIATLMHDVLVWLHRHVGNWGLAIICLTLLIRGVLFPLTHISLKKMRLMQDKMKVAKPRIDAIKAKFRKLPRDMQTRQREQQETMEVYRQVGINPADQIMGCLPLLISMPFFFALFRLLQGAVEFRHQGFLGWGDLSAADPTHIWPILTGATTFLSQKLGMSQSSGSSEMEQMQRNMLYMFPLMFVFFCWSAPLGLVVYWTTNNIVQIGQQYLLKIMLPPPEVDSQTASKTKTKTKTKRNPSETMSRAPEESGGGGRGKRRRR